MHRSAGPRARSGCGEAGVRFLPDLEALQSFLAVAEELSVRRAAERLHIDHSAISRRIKDLELRLGFELFYRTTREVQLTEAGRVLYEENSALLDGLRGSIEAARRVSTGRTGRIRVGYMSFAALAAMPAAVAAFSRRFPDVSVEIVYMSTQGQKLALAQGRLDAGFLIGPFDHGDFETQRIGADALLAALPVAHDLARQDAVRLRDLAAWPLVLGSMDMWSAYRLLLDEVFTARGLPLRPAFEPSSMLGILGLVAAGLGASILPDSIRQLGVPQVAWRPIADCSLRVETTLVWPKAAGQTVALFVETCRRLLPPAAAAER